MEFQFHPGDINDDEFNPCTTDMGNTMRPCCSLVAQKLCTFSSGCFFILFVLSLASIFTSLCAGRWRIIPTFEVLIALWLSTRTLSLFFWHQKDPQDADGIDSTYNFYITFINVPLLFLTEAIIFKVVSLWGVYRISHLNRTSEQKHFIRKQRLIFLGISFLNLGIVITVIALEITH